MLGKQSSRRVIILKRQGTCKRVKLKRNSCDAYINLKHCTADESNAVNTYLLFQLVVYQEFSTQSIAVQSPALYNPFYSLRVPYSG